MPNRSFGRVGALTVIATLTAGLFVGGTQLASAAPTPPPNPTDGQINDANARKSALANEVGRLSGELAAAQQRLTQLQNAAALAEQKVAYAVSEYRKAVDATQRAQQAAAGARADLADVKQQRQDEQTRFARYMQALYMGGQPDGVTGSLLTADDPGALLQASTFAQYEVQVKAGVIGTMQKLAVKQSNAEAKARAAEERARKAQKAANQRKQDSIEAQQAAALAVQNQADEEAAVQASVDRTQATLDDASEELATLNGQRATFVAYQKEQARLREIARQKRLAEQRRKAEAERQKALAAERMRQQRNNGGSSWTPPPPPRNSPPAPSAGGWTPEKAARAVARARSTLGMPYAWAGGGPNGPSYGACVPSAGAPNDCNVYGYDCSGLVMFAWGKGWDHYADTQYNQAGRFHPSPSQLRPGDLVFYGYRGASDLHHVAMYVGGGRIIEAPYSGGYVQYNNLYAYSDYYGATRPLT